MAQYRNNRIARAGDRVIGTYGGAVVTGIVQDVESGSIQFQDRARSVNAQVQFTNFFLAEDALAACNSIAQTVAPAAAAPQQQIAVVAETPAPAAAREALPGWPTA